MYPSTLDPFHNREKLGDEKRRATKEQTKKLLDGGFFKEAKYTTWLTNIVMVKTQSGKWKVENVHRLQKYQQGILKGYISFA